MWIDTLKLENIKCFEQKNVEFSHGFNLIVGDNGSGKTTILQSIMYSSAISGLPETKNTKFDIEDLQKITTIRRNPVVFRQQKCYPSSIILKLNTKRGPVWINTILKNKSTTSYSIESTKETLDETKMIKYIINKKTIPLFSYYESFSEHRSTIHPDKNHSERIPVTFNDKNGNEIPLHFRFKPYTNWSGSSKKLQDIYNWIRESEDHVINSEIDEGLSYFINKNIKKAVKIHLNYDIFFDFTTKEISIMDINENIVPLRLLSDSQLNIIALISDISIRATMINLHLKEQALENTPGIILIDEIDLHLHPKWQMRVVDDLKRTFPKIQFIATTHSPLIIQSLKPNEGDRLIDLNDPDTVPDYEYSGRSPEDILEEGMGIEMPQRSHRWKEMYHAAKEYYELLDKAESADEAERRALREKLDMLMIPYDNNPAYAAYTSFLKQKRIVTGIDKA